MRYDEKARYFILRSAISGQYECKEKRGNRRVSKALEEWLPLVFLFTYVGETFRHAQAQKKRHSCKCLKSLL